MSELNGRSIRKMKTLTLSELTLHDEGAFRNAVEEFRQSDPEWEFAHEFGPTTDFGSYVRSLEKWSMGDELADGLVAWTYLVGRIAGEIVGRLSIRHELNEYLRKVGGHIGYGVVKAHRGKGYATMMLRQAMPRCAMLGIERVLVTCDIDNIASARVIENCGGEFEGLTDLPELDVQKRRYWISTKQPTDLITPPGSAPAEHRQADPT